MFILSFFLIFTISTKNLHYILSNDGLSLYFLFIFTALTLYLSQYRSLSHPSSILFSYFPSILVKTFSSYSIFLILALYVLILLIFLSSIGWSYKVLVPTRFSQLHWPNSFQTFGCICFTFLVNIGMVFIGDFSSL